MVDDLLDAIDAAKLPRTARRAAETIGLTVHEETGLGRWPISAARVADLTGIPSAEQARRAITCLRRAGWLSVLYRGRNGANVYALHTPLGA